MKTRTIQQAIELGFDYENSAFETREQLEQEIINFLNENIDALPQQEDECEVTTHSRSQNVSYKDYVCSGEIVDFASNWHKDPTTKVYHSNFLNIDKQTGEATNFQLYYLVGETHYNAPEGYYYSESEKGHVKIEVEDDNE